MKEKGREKEFYIDGFLFHGEEMAEKANRELEGIKYIKGKTDMENPQMVLQVYHKIIEQGLFETPVGIGYLRELQDYFKAIPFIKNEDVKPIPVEDIIKQEAAQQQKEKEKKSPKKLPVSVVINIILAVMVAAMFVIASTSKSPTILNYEEQLLNKYAAWETELSQRERAVQEKERQLNIDP